MTFPSMLDPQGPDAAAIATLAWIMFAGAAVILLAVVGAVLIAAFGRDRWRAPLASRALVVGGGIAFPVVALSALLVYGLEVGAQLAGAGEPPVVRIEVIGEQWWWRIRYLDERDEALFETANEIRIPVGGPAELRLASHDVIHSFWVPNLAGKLDMIPGHVNRLRLRAERAGAFRGQCAEYCGGPHALMAFYVVAEPPDAFARWFERQGRPAEPPATPVLVQGANLFEASGCGACHAVRGTAAKGTIGPDLTHVGSRLSIGAGAFPNNAGTLAGWIADGQHLKPENLMPSFTGLAGTELRALAVWLASLE